MPIAKYVGRDTQITMRIGLRDLIFFRNIGMRVTDEEAGIIAEKIQHGTEMKLEGFDDMEGIVQATVEPPVEDFPAEIETPAVEEPPAPQVPVETPVEEPEQNDEFDDTGGL